MSLTFELPLQQLKFFMTLQLDFDGTTVTPAVLSHSISSQVIMEVLQNFF